jgi:hypothetical protein
MTKFGNFSTTFGRWKDWEVLKMSVDGLVGDKTIRQTTEPRLSCYLILSSKMIGFHGKNNHSKSSIYLLDRQKIDGANLFL